MRGPCVAPSAVQQRQAGIGIWLAKVRSAGIVTINAIASHLTMFVELI
jgi:hypothetical protein